MIDWEVRRMEKSRLFQLSDFDDSKDDNVIYWNMEH